MTLSRLVLCGALYFLVCFDSAGSQVTKQGWPISSFKKAAEEGDPRGQYLLGMAYLQGDGIAQDYKEAAEWLSRAAEQDLPKAQFQLGILLLQGNGVTQDYEEAAKWFLKAAEQNLPDAQFSLGLMHLQGDGVSQSYGESARWFRKAAEQGDPSAQCMLGGLYIEGYGVIQDYTEAYKWLAISLSGSPPQQILEKAKKWRAFIAEKMTSQQIEGAQKMARDWEAVPLFKPATGNVIVASTKPNPTDDNSHIPNLITRQGNLRYIIEGTRQMNATLEGRVIDSNGKPLAGAAVDYINLRSGKGGGLTASSKGEYKFTYYPGSYSVEVTRRGYKPWSHSGIILESKDSQHLDIVLVKNNKPDTMATLPPGEYARQAVESTQKKWESKYTDQFQYTVVDEPAIRPVLEADLSRPESKGHAIFGMAPRALVLVKVHNGERIHYTTLVSFLDGIPEPQVAFYDSVPFGSMARTYPMEEEEWLRVVKDLAPFYEVALEISKGPERFDSFLKPFLDAGPEPPVGISRNQVSQMASLPLHEYTLRNWLQFEGLTPDDSEVWRAYVEMNRLKNPKDLPKAIQKLSRELDEWSELLTKAGALNPKHKESVSTYLRRMFGEGLIFKTTPSSKLISRGFAESTVVYSAYFCHLGCNVLFAYIDGKIQVVGLEGLIL